MRIKLDDGAFVPERAHKYDAGLDLRSTETFWLHPGEHYAVDTGVHVEIPQGFVGLITSKSGLMLKGITSRGTIDSGYTGSIRAVLFNNGPEAHLIKAGDKITQLIVLQCWLPNIELVANLDDTERGENGFGSTGR
jgi:dUTP pyrophosphatase